MKGFHLHALRLSKADMIQFWIAPSSINYSL